MSQGSRNEADTRADLIDPKLVEAGWGVAQSSYIRREVNDYPGPYRRRRQAHFGIEQRLCVGIPRPQTGGG